MAGLRRLTVKRQHATSLLNNHHYLITYKNETDDRKKKEIISSGLLSLKTPYDSIRLRN